MLIIEFSYNFLYVWNCMKLYDKKFLIYGNYMIRSFGQPGYYSSIRSKIKVERVFSLYYRLPAPLFNHSLPPEL